MFSKEWSVDQYHCIPTWQLVMNTNLGINTIFAITLGVELGFLCFNKPMREFWIMIEALKTLLRSVKFPEDYLL